MPTQTKKIAWIKPWLLTSVTALVFVCLGLFATPVNHKKPVIHNSVGINEQINFQGRLLTSTGAVVPDGSYNVEFKIYQDGDGVLGGGDESLKWTETRTSSNKVLVKNGYFSVYLGSVTGFGSSVDWNQSNLWLSINIGGTGSPSWDGEMSPFTRFGASPYALNAKQLGGLSSSNFVQLAPSGVQADSTTNNSIYLNKTGASGNILQLQKNGSDVLSVTNGGSLRVNSTGTSGTVEKLRVNTPTTVDNSANVILSANAATSKPLVVQGAASQTANIQEWQNSSGTPMAVIDASGNAIINNKLQVGTAGGTIDQCATILGPTSCTVGIDNSTVSTETSNPSYGTFNYVSLQPASTNAGGGYGAQNMAHVGTLSSQNFSGNQGGAYNWGLGLTSGTINYLSGSTNVVQLQSAGTLTYGVGVDSQINSNIGTITNAYGLRVQSAAGSGSITNNYGILVGNQTLGSNDYGVAIGAADTQTLWLSNNADNTTASAGIAFGSSRDTNLYRSAAGTLKIDNKFAVGTLGTTDTAAYLCLNSSSILATCSGTSTGSAFVQGGNSFGATAVLGTNDANSLELKTGGTTKLTVDTTGNLTFAKETDRILSVANSSTSNTVGAALTVRAANGAGTANGGALSLTAGSADSGGTGVGGAVNINGGVGYNSNGGSINITPGNASGGAYAGGSVNISSGSGVASGQITLQTASSFGTYGSLNLNANGGTINAATGTSVQSINLGTGGTGAKTVTVGSTASTSSVTLQSGTSGITFKTAGTTACTISGSNGSLNCPGTGIQSQRFGDGSSAGGTVDTAIGYSASSSGGNSVVIGHTATSTSNKVVVIGQGSTATGSGDVVIGQAASAAGTGSIAIGISSNAGYTGSTAIGRTATTTANNQLVIGGSTNGTDNITQAYFGDGVTNAAPVGVTLNATGSSTASTAGASLSLQGGNAVSISNTNGGALYLNGGQGTGTGVGGNINLQIAKAGTTGSSNNALTTVATISGTDGSALFKNSANSTSGFQVQSSGSATPILNVDTANARVGIGTATPGTALDVNGTITVRGSSTLTSITGSVSETGGLFGSTTVTGTGTLFTSELGVGDQLVINGDSRTVVQINSNTQLIVNSTYSSSGTDASPKIIPASLAIKNGSGAARLTVNDRTTLLQTSSTNTTAENTTAFDLKVTDTGVVTTGTDTTIGANISVARTGATGGTINTQGLYVSAQGDSGGSSNVTAITGYGTGAYNSTGFLGQAVVIGSTALGTYNAVDGLLSSFYSTANVTQANALRGKLDTTASTGGSVTDAAGLRIQSAIAGSLVFANNYGIIVEAQTAGTNDYGVAIGAADTQTLWLSNNADNTTASAGIAFGSSRDTNLYRSATSTLKTDGKLQVGTLDTVTSNSASLCRDTSTTTLTACDSSNTTGRPFLQGGNAFGATGTLGTTDSNWLNLITRNTTHLSVADTGSSASDIYIGGSSPAAASTAQLILNRGASGSYGLNFAEANTSNWYLYSPGDPNLYLRDMTNSKMVAQFSPGAAGLASSSFQDQLIATAGAGQSANVLSVRNSSNQETFTVGPTGNTTVRPSTDSTTAFVVQNAAGSAIPLQVDTTNTTVAVNNRLAVSKSSTSTIASADQLTTINLYDTGVVTSGNDDNVALSILATRTGATGGTFSTSGINASAVGDTTGTSYTYGVQGIASNANNNYGIFGRGQNSSTATVANAYGGFTEVYNTSTGTVTSAIGSYIGGGYNPSGTITSQFGLYVAPQTLGINSYSAYIGTGTTATLWVGADQQGTTAAAGIAFGSARDTNLYRGGAGQLRTDSSLLVQATSTTAFQINNSSGTALFTANTSVPGLTFDGDATLNSQKDLRFADADSSNWVAFQAPATVASNVTWTLPGADSAGCLQSDGSGTLSIAACGDTNAQSFTSNGNYTVPTNALLVVVEAWGGGGGGGGGSGNTLAAMRSGGGGGGGGAYNTTTILASVLGGSGTNVPVTVGAAGSSGNGGTGAAGVDGGAGGATCLSTTTNCAGNMYLQTFGGGGGNGDGTAGNGGGGGGGSQAVGATNATAATGGTGGSPLGAAAGAQNSGNGGAGGATAAATGAAGGTANWGGGGGGSSSSTGAGNSGAGGGSNQGGAAGGAGGSCAITTCTQRSGGAGGHVPGLAGGGGTAGAGAGVSGGNGTAGAGSGGDGGGGGANNPTNGGTGGAGGAGGARGGGGGGGGASAGTGTQIGGAGGAGGAGYLRVWTYRGAGADLAEIYSTNDNSVEAGDVVSIDSSLQAGVKKSQSAYDSTAIGIISTKPGLVLGDQTGEGTNSVLVALAGRVPVKVTDENGVIKPGDYLTPSSTPGMAMKATKSGLIIGQALTKYDGNGPGYVVAFIKNTHSGGSGLNDILPGLSDANQSTPQSIQQQALSYFMSSKASLNPDSAISEITADRVSAGLELITPSVVASDVSLDTLKASSGKDINVQLGADGQFVVGDTNGVSGLTVDANGNARFSGTVTADKIVANQIQGLEILTDKISSLSASQQQSQTTPQNQTPPINLDNFVVQNATISEDLNVTGSLFANGALKVAGPADFLGKSVFYKLATFIDRVVFNEDVTFNGQVAFSNNTGGFATIKAGEQSVDVKFTKPFPDKPVVTVSINDGQFVSYAYKSLTANGFTIVLQQPATKDIDFSWTALNIQDAKVSQTSPTN